jgi:hypothetical protein
MARLVYLPTVERGSWLLWTISGVGSCLRDYRFNPTREMWDRSRDEIDRLLATPGHVWEMAEDISYTERDFWCEEIRMKNVETGLPSITSVKSGGAKQRLLAKFTSEVVPLIDKDDALNLKSVIWRWVDGFAKIVNKKEKFNRWDDDDATASKSPMTGFGWLSTMLEYCRANRHLQYIRTGRTTLDFAMIAAEVAFVISSKSNPFQPGREDCIEPDGIGVREADGSLLVLEMKGPQDDHDLLSATLQAFCGALAVFAKQEMIVRLARSAGERRPEVAVATVSSERPRLGLYIVIVLKEGEQVRIEDDARLCPALDLLMGAFPPLRETVYFVVEQSQLASIGNLQTTRVYP